MSAIRFFLAVMLLATSQLVAHAQAGAWQSALAVSTAVGNVSAITSTVADGSGNVLVGGYYDGSITLGNTTLPAASRLRGFVAKWNVAAGTYTWAFPIGSPEFSSVSALALAGSAVYVLGYFQVTATVGSQSVASAGDYDTYVTRLDDAGASVSAGWVQRLGGTGLDFSSALAVQGSAVYVAGYTTSPTVSFGSLSLGNLPTSNYSGFVARLNDGGNAGSFAWAQALTASTKCLVKAVAVQGSSVYVGGLYSGSLPFGTAMLTPPAATAEGAMLLKLSDQGSSATPAWAAPLGGSDTNAVLALLASGSAVYAAGYFGGSPAAFGTATASSQGASDAFVLKATDLGTGLGTSWVQALGGASADAATCLALQGSQLYMGGYFTGASATAGSLSLAGQGAQSAFVACLADAKPTATFAWAQPAGGLYQNGTNALALAGTTVVAGGFVQGTAHFGSYTLSTASYGNYGFLANLATAAGLAATAPTATAALQPYPNPAHSRARVAVPASARTLTLVDALGRIIRTQAVAPAAGETEVALELIGVAPGVYTLRVAAGATATATASRLVVE